MFLNNDQKSFKSMIFAIMTFVGAGVVSCGELRYAIFSETATATITSRKASQYSSRRGKPQVVTYEWKSEKGTTRRDEMRFPGDWQPPADNKLEIDYLPGVKSSRLHGDYNYFTLCLFGGSLLVIGFVAYRIGRQAYD